MGEPEIVVVGAGIVGCAIARELAADHTVAVVERDSVASGASGLAAGEVTMTPAYDDEPAVAAYANAFFRADGGIEFHERPSVELVPTDGEEMARRRATRLGERIPVASLDPAAVVDRWPRLDADSFASAIRYGACGFVDAERATRSLAADVRDRGGTIRPGVEVTGVRRSEERVVIETTDGPIDAAAVVVAAGPQTRPLLADHVELPLRPYRTQCARVRIEPPLDDRVPMLWLPDERLYARPTTAGELLVGGRATACSDPATVSRDADPVFRDAVLAAVERTVDAESARIVDGWAGVDVGTPDGRPIVDELRPGVAVACGFHGRGVMTAPVAGAVVRSLLVGGFQPVPAAPFALDRFESRSASFPLFGVADDEGKR